MPRTQAPEAHQLPLLTRTVVPAATAVLAVAAGAIHLAHNYLPMQPPSGTSGPPPAAAEAASGMSGLMSLIMPHLSQVMLLNFAAFVGLGAVLVTMARFRTQLRVAVDALLVGLCLATLYLWNAMGRANPAGTGSMALVVELALIVIAVADAAFVAASRTVSRRPAVHSLA